MRLLSLETKLPTSLPNLMHVHRVACCFCQHLDLPLSSGPLLPPRLPTCPPSLQKCGATSDGRGGQAVAGSWYPIPGLAQQHGADNDRESPSIRAYDVVVRVLGTFPNSPWTASSAFEAKRQALEAMPIICCSELDIGTECSQSTQPFALSSSAPFQEECCI